MVRTALCEILGIEHPIIQASIGPFSSPRLTAAVSNAGAIGSVGTALFSAQEVKEQIADVRNLTDRPFIVNHTARPLNEDAFQVTLDANVPVISMALGDPGDLVKQAHDIGATFIQQVHSVAQARQVAEQGVDIIIAQGGEAGGFSGVVSTMALVPQVVDAVSPIPVIAAGGIADGRGLAAALVLGAQGVNIGTRFLACTEADVDEAWKRGILEASSEDAIKMEFARSLIPPPPGAYQEPLPRALRVPFVEEWNAKLDEAAANADRLGKEVIAALKQGRGHEYAPFTGQTAGMIRDVASAAEIVRRMVTEAEAALQLARSTGG